MMDEDERINLDLIRDLIRYIVLHEDVSVCVVLVTVQLSRSCWTTSEELSGLSAKLVTLFQDGSILVFLPGWDDISNLNERLMTEHLFKSGHSFIY